MIVGAVIVLLGGSGAAWAFVEMSGDSNKPTDWEESDNHWSVNTDENDDTWIEDEANDNEADKAEKDNSVTNDNETDNKDANNKKENDKKGGDNEKTDKKKGKSSNS